MGPVTKIRRVCNGAAGRAVRIWMQETGPVGAGATAGARGPRVCPKCGVPLIVVEFQGVEVDHCLDCRGTWLDAGELELLLELAGVGPAELAEALPPLGRATVGRRRCPRCARRMETARVGRPPGVEIDRCRAGEGVWLDAGELAGLVRVLAAADAAALAGFLGELFRHELAPDTEEGAR